MSYGYTLPAAENGHWPLIVRDTQSFPARLRTEGRVSVSSLLLTFQEAVRESRMVTDVAIMGSTLT